MSGHTPGPWIVQQLNHRDGDLWLQIGHYRDGVAVGPVAEIVHEAHIAAIARLKYLVTPESEQRANAALIAQAPTLATEIATLRARLSTVEADLARVGEERDELLDACAALCEAFDGNVFVPTPKHMAGWPESLPPYALALVKIKTAVDARQSPPSTAATVTVCSSCLRASCWQGAFYCEDYQTAGTVERTVAELTALNRESPHYWAPPSTVGQPGDGAEVRYPCPHCRKPTLSTPGGVCPECL